MSRYILAIDQGTSSSRAILYNLSFKECASYQLDHKQYYPQSNWVEHDPTEIWNNQLACCYEVLNGIALEDIIGIGITNQRETIVAWDKLSGQPCGPAIVWQDRRTDDACIQDKAQLGSDYNQHKTGLNLDPYFSAPKIRWILDKNSSAQDLLKDNRLCVGTIDSWLTYKLTGNKDHITDYSNASRTNLLNIKSLNWDEDLLRYYNIPFAILPKLVDSIGVNRYTEKAIFGTSIPILAMAGDQQASLFGHEAYEKGMAKCTFGTGAFILQNIGKECQFSQYQLLTTIAWTENGQATYALEGAIFHAGSALKWLRENLGIIQDYAEIETICEAISDTNGLYFVPAFTGLGAPYWDPTASAIISGMSRSTQKEHIVRAAVESIAYQTKDILDIMQRDSSTPWTTLYTDGGVSQSDFLISFLADILQIPVARAASAECTALGIARMAAKSQKISLTILEQEHRYNATPMINRDRSEFLYSGWRRAVSKSRL